MGFNVSIMKLLQYKCIYKPTTEEYYLQPKPSYKET